MIEKTSAIFEQPKMILSASAISTLKACPFKYRNRYVLGLRKIETPEPLRVGTNWHEGLDVMSLKPEQPCPACSDKGKPDKTCIICQGTGFVDGPLDVTTRMLNDRYSNMYPNMPKDVKEIERAVLLYSLFAYKFYYDDDPMEVVAREMPFRIPLLNPDTHKPVPGVFIDGKLDKLVRLGKAIGVMEHKSTSDAVDPESDYWGHLKLDTQTFIYVYAAQRMQADGLLEPWKIKASDPPISDILYDVWHKPSIRPKKLSAADCAEFLRTSSYFGAKFSREFIAGGNSLVIDGEDVAFERNKATKNNPCGAVVFRETPDMYGARLFNDMDERPDYYFGRKSIGRTSDDIEQFERELYAIYQTVEAMRDNDSWYHNEFECTNFGRCEFTESCFTGQQLDPDNPPTGFKCIFKKGK